MRSKSWKRKAEVVVCSSWGCNAIRLPSFQHVRWYAVTQKKLRTEKGLGEAITLEQIEKGLGIQQPEDWYTVTMTDAYEMGLPRRVKRVTQLAEMLKEKYPTLDWGKMVSMRGKFGLQRRLERAVEALFPDVAIVINARKEAGIINPSTGRFLELDVFIPSLNLAFEYQERHHYIRTSVSDVSLETVKRHDSIKKQLVADSGITLIVVPCWWDNRLESLAATIKFYRPDLAAKFANISDSADIISEEPPEGYFDKYVTQIQDIGEPITPCFFTTTHVDPTNWWVFEKYDGIRGFWNPIKKIMYSKTGKPFILHPSVIDDLPKDTFLDGELWFGRDNFQESMKLANRMDVSEINWSAFKYMVFDVPTSKGNYSERYAELCEAVNKEKRNYVEVANYVVCKDTTHLEQLFQDIIDQGGEGIILRDPSSPYTAGRSAGYLKHKKYRDAEAKIIGISESLLTWKCELPNGIRFTAPAGTMEFAKRCNPQPGDVVSFKHRGYLFGSNKPKMPTLYRIRKDLTWEEVVTSWKENKTVPKVVKRARKLPHRPMSYWENIENRRKFLLDFAKKMKIDPYDLENWRHQYYNLKLSRGSNLLKKYDESMADMLSDTFEELSAKKEKDVVSLPTLRKRPRSHWQRRENRREFFCTFASQHGFDPLIPKNWDRVTRAQIITQKGMGCLTPFKGHLREALKDAFPELNWDSKAI